MVGIKAGVIGATWIWAKTNLNGDIISFLKNIPNMSGGKHLKE